ncbi:MAG: YkgJ family cysteine cluster protein, partial [Planctomycetes bacterium]|nr:YkgJ family cysteine cluster protein [Planctomycetota bacterium]
ILGFGALIANKRKAVSGNVNWILVTSVMKARARGLYHLVPADKPTRLDCLMDACAKCCNSIGTPVVTQKEADTIGADSIMKGKDSMFLKSQGCVCSFLKDGFCSIYAIRPKGCREYPWYNIKGKLYYDKGCPGVKYDIDERPDVSEIQPIENFFPQTPKLVVWIIKKMCISSNKKSPCKTSSNT